MCESCVPTCSVPLRISTNGNEVGRITLLIDNDELGTVIDVSVDAEDLIYRVKQAVSDHEALIKRRETEALVRRMIAGRQIPSFTPTHALSVMPRSVPFELRGWHVELIDDEPEGYWDLVSVLFPNGYTARVEWCDLKPITEETPG